MQLACALLLKTRSPIKEIAIRTGYPSLQRFNKVVRQTFGCSPRMLREQRPLAMIHTDAGTSAQKTKIAEGAEPIRDL